MNAKLHQMLADLRRALYDAISESDDVHRTWRSLREEGYLLSLTVDCRREDEAAEEGDEDPVPALTAAPTFRINGGDLSFLRSIGIDPTRRPRKKR